MHDSRLEIFVDFNNLGPEADTYTTWASQIDGTVPLGAVVHLTDHEEVEMDGVIVGVSSDRRRLIVKAGSTAPDAGHDEAPPPRP